MEIKGSTFLITGGSSGLGAATARRFAAAGANVVIADVNDEAGQSLAAEIGAGTHFARTDVTSQDSVQNALALLDENFGALHGLINCAGIAIAARVLSRRGPHDLDAFARVVAVNLTGTFNVIRLAAEYMAQSQGDGVGERGGDHQHSLRGCF